MEESYKIIFNMKDEIFKVFEKSLQKDGYEILYKDEKILFVKKSEKNLTQEQIKRIVNIEKIHANGTKGILFMDITSAVQYLIKLSNEEQKKDGKFRWMMRQAYTKAILDKSKNEG